MPIAADRPGAAVTRAVTLRIKRGAKLLSDVKIGRSRVIVGGGKTAQLRLKNAGLADECIVIDTRTEPFGIENRLGPDDVRVNGRAILSSLIRLGDVIELAGLTLELVDGDPKAAPPPPPPAVARPGVRPPIRPPSPPEPPASVATSLPLPEEAIDPYLGKRTAARVNKSDLERSRELLEAKARAAARAPAPPARPTVPDPQAAARTTPAARPPWIELVGDAAISEARLYLQDGTVAGRQGDVRVRHPSVSKKHARFSLENGRLFVEDLGSTNGVWINRERISARRPLAEGDTLHLGAVEFSVRIPAAAPSEVTNVAGLPDPSSPAAQINAAREERVSEGDFLGTERQPPGAVPRARGPRELHTEAEGVPSSMRDADLWEQEAAAELGSPAIRDRGTEREIPAAKGRRASAEPAPVSPFETEDDDAPATGTGRPGRRDETDPDGVKVPARLSAPVPQVSKGPTPSSLFGDVEDLSERYSTDSPKQKATRERAPVRTTVRPPDTLTRDAFLVDDDFVPRKRRSFGKMFGVAFLGFLFGGLVVGVLAAWPRVTALMNAQAPLADASLDGRDGTEAIPDPKTRSRQPGGKTKDPRAGRAKSGTAPEVGLPRDVEGGEGDGDGDVDLDGAMEDGPRSIFEDAPLDLRSDARLDKELASLEKNVAERGLRAEREIGADELKSIFLGESTATVRRLYKDDGFDLAPSAADEDPRDAEAKRQGAKQIDPNRVNALIRAKFPAVKRCLVGASVKRGKARVVVEFTIQPTGKTENVSVVDSDIGGTAFKSCVSGVVRGIKFPKTKDQSVIVQFPFVFTYN